MTLAPIETQKIAALAEEEQGGAGFAGGWGWEMGPVPSLRRKAKGICVLGEKNPQDVYMSYRQIMSLLA